MSDTQKFDPFTAVNPENALVIRAMEPWLALWQQAIAYYWTVKSHDKFDEELSTTIEQAPSLSKSHMLFYILTKLGLKNM
ncbi:MAG: hypothetical protein HRT35_22995, partial [Algicola sp.]|nr:hypothetical protein [Algicola sp.]